MSLLYDDGFNLYFCECGNAYLDKHTETVKVPGKTTMTYEVLIKNECHCDPACHCDPHINFYIPDGYLFCWDNDLIKKWKEGKKQVWDEG